MPDLARDARSGVEKVVGEVYGRLGRRTKGASGRGFSEHPTAQRKRWEVEKNGEGRHKIDNERSSAGMPDLRRGQQQGVSGTARWCTTVQRMKNGDIGSGLRGDDG